MKNTNAKSETFGEFFRLPETEKVISFHYRSTVHETEFQQNSRKLFNASVRTVEIDKKSKIL